MQTLQVVSGNPNSPVPGTSIFQSDLLRNAFVHFMFIDNGVLNGISPSPEYTVDATLGILTLTGGNVWVAGNKVIIVYSKCGC